MDGVAASQGSASLCHGPQTRRLGLLPRVAPHVQEGEPRSGRAPAVERCPGKQGKVRRKSAQWKCEVPQSEEGSIESQVQTKTE